MTLLLLPNLCAMPNLPSACDPTGLHVKIHGRAAWRMSLPKYWRWEDACDKMEI